MGGGKPGGRNIGDGAICWYRQLYVHQGVHHVHQNLREGAEEIMRFHLSHWQDQISVDGDNIILGCL